MHLRARWTYELASTKNQMRPYLHDSASKAQSELAAHQRAAKPVLQMMCRRPFGSRSCAKPSAPARILASASEAAALSKRARLSSSSISMLRGTVESRSVLGGRGNLVGCGLADMAITLALLVSLALVRKHRRGALCLSSL